ncbi:MAG TPA: CHAP domain-containing protein [Nonomuraea sp.]|nr:CHAP domain-containing protein [Nonomuraea sp.]
MQKFIELLESQLGYSERASGHTKFGAWYGKDVEFDADYSAAPWCEMYLSWAAHKLGYEEWIGQFAWTVAHAKWFKEQGAWGRTPKPGAFVYYDWSGSNSIDRIDHVGVVIRVEGDTIVTIEGNIDGGVAKRKERDTSKVVGYGYPERVKARLDEEAARQAEEAKKKAEEQASLPPGPGTDVGVLQMPTDGLTAMIPQPGREEGARSPLAARPKPDPTTAKKPQEATAATPSPAPAATSGPAGAGTTAKKGKHAKPATADTTSATAEPLPTHADASATGPLPAIDSPTLVGSALVAALALLAVAKTRQNRARLATATATATAAAPSRPARNAPSHRRRKRRGTPAPQHRTTRPAAEHPAPELIATARPELAATPSPEVAATGHTGRRRRGEHPIAASSSASARRLLDTRPFDPFADAALHRTPLPRTPDHHTGDHWAEGRATDHAYDRHTADRGSFTPSFDTGFPQEPLDTGFLDEPLDAALLDGSLDTGPFEPCWDTGPMRRIRGTDSYEDLFGPEPVLVSSVPQPVREPGAVVVDTGPFPRVVIPGATSAFDAFTPSRRAAVGDILAPDAVPARATYRGRRRRRDSPREERFAIAQSDLRPRGRRHRELATAESGRGRHHV